MRECMINLLVMILLPWVLAHSASAQEAEVIPERPNVPGLVDKKPKSGRFVKIGDRYMVPNKVTISGTTDKPLDAARDCKRAPN